MTFGSSNLIVQTVPPVKSMAYWRPTLPPVIGPRRMKIRPGIGDEEREGEEPVPLADDVKHACAPRLAAARPDVGRARNSSSVTPYSAAFRAHGCWTTIRSTVRVTTIAVNIDTSTPMIRTRPKPRIVEEPNRNRIVAVIRLDTFESRIEFQARLKPGLDRRRQALAHPQLLLGPLEDQDVGVDRHAHREHEARDAGEGQRHRDQPEQGEHDERVVDQRAAGDHAGEPVVDDHEDDDHQDRDQRRRAGSAAGTASPSVGLTVVLRELLDRERQLAELEDRDEVLGLGSSG